MFSTPHGQSQPSVMPVLISIASPSLAEHVPRRRQLRREPLLRHSRPQTAQATTPSSARVQHFASWKQGIMWPRSREHEVTSPGPRASPAGQGWHALWERGRGSRVKARVVRGSPRLGGAVCKCRN